MTIKVFISHMNKEDILTQISHQFSDFLNSDKRFSVWIDTEHFGKKQIVQKSKIEEIIRSGIAKSQIFVVIYFPEIELSRDLSEWLLNEERKAIYDSMPILEIYLHGATYKPDLKPNELNFRKRHILTFDSEDDWKNVAKSKIFEIAKKYKMG